MTYLFQESSGILSGRFGSGSVGMTSWLRSSLTVFPVRRALECGRGVGTWKEGGSQDECLIRLCNLEEELGLATETLAGRGLGRCPLREEPQSLERCPLARVKPRASLRALELSIPVGQPRLAERGSQSQITSQLP